MKTNKRGDFRGMRGTLPKNTKGELNGNWKGGKHHRKDGYELVRIGVVSQSAKGARYKLKHRIIMEKHLGRVLLRSEIVHHKNGNMSDNRLSNLELMSQAKHAKTHIKQDRKTGRIISNKEI
jgi:uncharacterized protein (DUF1330 family)